MKDTIGGRQEHAVTQHFSVLATKSTKWGVADAADRLPCAGAVP